MYSTLNITPPMPPSCAREYGKRQSQGDKPTHPLERANTSSPPPSSHSLKHIHYTHAHAHTSLSTFLKEEGKNINSMFNQPYISFYLRVNLLILNTYNLTYRPSYLTGLFKLIVFALLHTADPILCDEFQLLSRHNTHSGAPL